MLRVSATDLNLWSLWTCSQLENNVLLLMYACLDVQKYNLVFKDMSCVEAG
jgi:hypothetical protein